MKTYRDWLDERHVPRGPWCVLELYNIKPNDSAKVIPLKKQKSTG